MRLDIIKKHCALTVATILSLFCAALLLAAPATARDYRPVLPASAQFTYDPTNEVDVELVLAVDISQSMDTEEQEGHRADCLCSCQVEQDLRFKRFYAEVFDKLRIMRKPI